MLTIFSTPRPFKGEFKTIQENAISSWINIMGDKEIILFDPDDSLEFMQNNDIKIINNLKLNSFGTPLISDLFMQSEKLGEGPIYCFINCDIILPENFIDTVNICSKKLNKYLMIGHRFDLDYDQSIDFSNEDQKSEYRKYASVNAQKHDKWGIDYFVFTAGIWDSIPDFAIGRFMYDNWLIWKARRNRIPVIDATNDVMAIHQNHGYHTKGFSGEKSVRNSVEAQENKRLFGNAWNFGIQDSTHEIKEGNIRLKNNLNEESWYLYRLRKVYPEWKWIMILYSKLYRLVNKSLK